MGTCPECCSRLLPSDGLRSPRAARPEPCLRRTLPTQVGAPERARRALLALRSEVDGAVFADAELLTSELVSNAVRHAGLRTGQIELAVWLEGDGVRVQVADHGPGFAPGDQRRAPDEEGGFGLDLVEQIADRWGIERDHGARVWFELATPR
jgi:anti-sigma regulatory factor (Ser/Thr protein kinase)